VALLSGLRPDEAATGKTETLPAQLTGGGLEWRAYADDLVAATAPGTSACTAAVPRNPFAAIPSLAQDPTCGSSISGTDRLITDLADPESTPAFSYVLPGRCNDGSAVPCTPGALAGLAAADAWLRTVVPGILASKAYTKDGLIIITFDEGRSDDAEAGGGRVGALLLSPFVGAGTTIDAPYDQFTLLRSIEELFGLDPLGHASTTSLKPFGPRVYGAWKLARSSGG
jgi:hypothetical protein